MDEKIYKLKTFSILCSIFFSVDLFAVDVRSQEQPGSMDCVIEPYLVTEVSSAVNGIIQSVYVEKSNKVRKGQKLARLESSVEKTSVALSKAKAKQKEDIDTKRINWNFYSGKQRRVGELFKNKAVTSHEKEEAEMNTEIARLEYKRVQSLQRIAEMELARAEAALKLRTIRSPISGVIIEKYLSPGESVKDRPLFKLAQLDPLRVIVIAQTEMFGKILPGMEAEVRTITNPDIPLTAVVDIVAPVIDAASGTFDIMLSLPNPEHSLPGGLRCKIQFNELKAVSR